MITRRWLFSIALPLIVLTGCSSTPENEALEPAPLVSFEATAELDEVWNESIGNGQGGLYNRLQPVIRGEVIYAASADGEVKALATPTGEELWEIDIDQSISGGVGMGDKQLYIATPNGDVIALDILNGRELWRASVSSEVLSAPMSSVGTVVVQTFDGHVYGLDSTDGERLWQYKSSRPSLTLRASATPVIQGDTVFAGLSNGRVVALDLESGQVKWEARVAVPQGESEIERIVDVNGSPLLINSELYAISYQGRLLRLDRNTGRILWSLEASSDSGLTEGFGNIYYSSAKGSVVAVNRANGSITWQQTQLARRFLSPPTAYDNYIIVGDLEGYVHVLSQLDGSMVARDEIGDGGVRVRILADNGLLYVFGNEGDLVAYKIVE